MKTCYIILNIDMPFFVIGILFNSLNSNTKIAVGIVENIRDKFKFKELHTLVHVQCNQ